MQLRLEHFTHRARIKRVIVVSRQFSTLAYAATSLPGLSQPGVIFLTNCPCSDSTRISWSESTSSNHSAISTQPCGHQHSVMWPSALRLVAINTQHVAIYTQTCGHQPCDHQHSAMWSSELSHEVISTQPCGHQHSVMWPSAMLRPTFSLVAKSTHPCSQQYSSMWLSSLSHVNISNQPVCHKQLVM